MNELLQGLLITVLIILTVGFTLFAWAIWKARASFKKLWVEIKKAWHNAHHDAYPKATLYEYIAQAEARNNSKRAVYWRRRLYEIYPEEIPHGPH